MAELGQATGPALTLMYDPQDPPMTSQTHHFLGIDAIHTRWDHSLPPRLTIQPGESVTFETREPSQGKIAREVATGTVPGSLFDTPAELRALVARSADQPAATGPGTDLPGHALTGPVAIAGAEPGDTLTIEVLQIIPAAWGWTSLGPKHGSLLDSEVDDRYLALWDLRDGAWTWFGESIRIPIQPFCGVMGVAPTEPGSHETSPPRAVGGNIDVRQLTAGAILHLPVVVPGALFSVGDVHAAQGDGEACGTAIEMDATVTLRFDLIKGRTIQGPRFITTTASARAGASFAASASNPDLYYAAREAMRGVLDEIQARSGLSRPEAVAVASVCADLRISQIVNSGVYTVTAFLPLEIFGGGRG